MVRTNLTSTSSPMFPRDDRAVPLAHAGGPVPVRRSRGKPLPLGHSPMGGSEARLPQGAPSSDPSTLPSTERAIVHSAYPSASAAANSAESADAGSVDYDVGYKKPPKHTQFKKGQSGNPKGRAKESRKLATIVEDIAGELIVVRENGRPRKMSKLEIVIKKLMSDALQGNPKAREQLMRVLKDLGQFESPAKSEAGLAAQREEEGLNTFQQDILDDFVIKRFAELHPSVSGAETPPASAPETAGELADNETADESGVSEASDELEDDFSEPFEEERQTITLEQHNRKYGESKPLPLRAIKDD